MRRTGFRFLNTTTPTHYSLTGRNAWNLLDVALVCSSCVSLRTSTVISKLLGSDHSVVLTTANANTIPEANDFPKWNFTKADWPPLPPPFRCPYVVSGLVTVSKISGLGLESLVSWLCAWVICLWVLQKAVVSN